ncbi:MAG TPA: hypothetical protein DIC64_00550 [Alphaproteobacteria bacterium]|nr:hypothetical protein [Alphaproteobacteria bacterium]
MKHLKLSCLAVLLSVIAACAGHEENAVTTVQTIEPYQHDVIALENLYTRVIAYCYTSAEYTAEECARALEKDAFVRLTEIPKFVADRDFLREGTYPTRRWRDEDFAPRW